MLHFTISNKKYFYSEDSKFLIQLAYGKKSSYKTQLTVTGNLSTAIKVYDSIKLGKDWKKRLVLDNDILYRDVFVNKNLKA